MCKLIVFTNGSMVKDFNGLVDKCAELVRDQKDGFGYVARGLHGNFGYKTTQPHEKPWRLHSVPAWCETYDHEYFGKRGRVTGGIVFHGRISTNVKSLLNTHPIQRDNWALCHNGVVNHTGQAYERMTQNDSEHVLYNLIKGIDQVAENLTGYYAFGAIDPKGFLHVGRDKTAPLYYAYFKSIDSGVFATTIEILQGLARYFKEALSVSPMKKDTYLVFDKNQCMLQSSFESRGYTIKEAYYADDSLGHSLDDVEVIDDTYTILYYDRYITAETYGKLPNSEKVKCEVMRPDGTFLWPDELNSDDLPSYENYYDYK